MIDKIMPMNCIRQWQFQKYKTALLPIIIIVLGFILKLGRIQIPYISILMGLSLVAYLAVIFLYRIGNPAIPEQDNVIVSPVHGKVISVEQSNGMIKIRINKSFFDPIELRCPIDIQEKVIDSEIEISYGNHEIQMSFGEKTPIFFHDHGKVMGSLLGLMLGTFNVTLRFNESILSQPIPIKNGDIVKAGETILCELSKPVIIKS